MSLIKRKKKWALLLTGAVCLATASIVYVKAAYLTTNRDTLLPPDKVTYDLQNYEGYELVHETDTLKYYFRDDRDIFAIEDKRSGYTWRTGIDVPFNADIDAKILEAATEDEILAAAEPQEAGMNSTYIGLANSLISVEYFESETNKTISSASKDGVESKLVTLNDNPATRRLDVDFKTIDLQVKVRITLLDDGINYQIFDEEITGKGRSIMTAIDITPFLGASGGMKKLYNKEEGLYASEESQYKEKYKVPGYIFIPDGCGSLVRLNNNSTSFSIYYGRVYGEDPAQMQFYQEMLLDNIPLKDPIMPVFGIAHGDKQAAFVAYADDADEYMEIVVRPEQNLTFYNWAYPRFVYNVNYFQVYNKKGEGFFTLMSELNKMNIDITYKFLSGDGTNGSYAADYTGMALEYREHLKENGTLKELEKRAGDIPLRLDFIMSDSKKGIIGNEQVTVTSVEDVRNILNKVIDKLGIHNLNSGLLGWQKGGETIAKPDSDSFSWDIGREKEFVSLIKDFDESGIDISLSRDYSLINKEMMSYSNNAARHVNSWYMELDKSVLLPVSAPVTDFGYALPKKSAQWLREQFSNMKDYTKSMTVAGMSNVLLSTYNRDGVEMTASKTIALYQDTVGKIAEQVKINLDHPNMYLWKNTDRFLQCPVGISQYVFETDTVPFLQMVLHGTMELYAPYANFSFYTQKDILRMIDYNLSPSFILSKEPSYLLKDTASSYLYSTEYEQYEELIGRIYNEVNNVLKQVVKDSWVNRTVLENGVIENTYQSGSGVKYVVINYTEETVNYHQTAIAPLSAVVLE